MLKRMLNPFRAVPENGMPGTLVEIQYETEGALCTLRLDESWRVRLSDKLVAQLTDWTSLADVEVAYK
jgi:DNA polymerase-3 subunit alpha